MRKNIYITEEISNFLSQITDKPLNSLPKDIQHVLNKHQTSLGMHPSFPSDETESFDMMVTKTRFDEIIKQVKELKLDDYSSTSINKHLQNLITKCKEIEKNFKNKLENICYNHIIDIFKVPEGLVAFKCTLVEHVDDGKANVINNDSFTFINSKQHDRLHDAVYKRRIINAIITGGAKRLSVINKTLIGELYEVSPELPKLYKDIMILSDYLLFTKNNIGISDKNKKQSGISYLTIGNENTKNKIIVEGEIFPVLLHESIRGFLEMFAAYGLPASKKESEYVMSKADFVNAEPWDNRIGPILWDYIMTAFDNPSTEMIPMLLTILFSQKNTKFNEFLKEFFTNTKRGKEIAQKILNKAYNEIESDNFEEIMQKKQTETTIINDNYFRPEEL